METYFAPPGRARDEELTAEIDIVSNNPVMSGLLNSISGLLAILDEHRQIVAFNDSFLRMLGVDDPSEAMGLRHGQVFDCIHAEEEPDGCGTFYNIRERRHHFQVCSPHLRAHKCYAPSKGTPTHGQHWKQA